MTSTVSNNPVSFKALIPKKLATQGMIDPIRDACIKDAKAMAADLKKVTKTWEGDKPVIESEAKLEPYNVFPKAFTIVARPRPDGSKGYWKYVWLDLGTKVRYAVMGSPFVPKTRKGELNSWKGKGGMLFVSKKHPMPGIKARRFTLALRKKWEKPFKEHIQAALKKAAKASGHSAR
jgi:hypothetical protein